MEMIFCFCQKCLDEIDRLHSEGGMLPAFLNAYSGQLCANCGRQLQLVGTRKFEVEMLNVQEQDGVHQYTEFAVLRFIPEAEVEAEPNYLLIIGCSQRKDPTPQPLYAMYRYDGPTYRTLRKLRREGCFPDNVDVQIISARYGLLGLREPILNYEQKMIPERAAELAPVIQKDLRHIMTAYGGLTGEPISVYDQVFINLGKTYMRTLKGFHWGLVSTMEASGRIGQKNSQMKAWLERISQERTEGKEG